MTKRAPRPIHNALDNWAAKRFMRILDELDPLTARRLRSAFSMGITVQEHIDLEDSGIREIAQRLAEEVDKREGPSSKG